MNNQRPGGGKKGFEKCAAPEFGAGSSDHMFSGNASHLKSGVCLALPLKDVLLRVRGHLFTSRMPAVSTARSSGGPQFQNNSYSTSGPALLPICMKAKGRLGLPGRRLCWAGPARSSWLLCGARRPQSAVSTGQRPRGEDFLRAQRPAASETRSFPWMLRGGGTDSVS